MSRMQGRKPSPDRRQTQRIPAAVLGRRRPQPTAFCDVAVEDLSCTGFRFSQPALFSTGTVVQLDVPGIGRRQAKVVDTKGRRYACEWLMPLSADEIVHVAPGASLIRIASLPQTATPYPDPVVQPYHWVIRILALAVMGGLSWAAIVIGLRHLF